MKHPQDLEERTTVQGNCIVLENPRSTDRVTQVLAYLCDVFGVGVRRMDVTLTGTWIIPKVGATVTFDEGNTYLVSFDKVGGLLVQPPCAAVRGAAYPQTLWIRAVVGHAQAVTYRLRAPDEPELHMHWLDARRVVRYVAGECAVCAAKRAPAVGAM